MSCCAPGAELHQARAADEEILLASRPVHDGLRQTDLSVPDIHCGGCLQRIEATLGKLDGVANARANLSARRVRVLWRGEAPPPFIPALQAIGYAAHLHDISAEKTDPVLNHLLRALAVAGFAASNIMLLSVSVWAGADPVTRDAFHWISALIALPTLAYSGRIFFASAWRSLRHGRTNMDVPISVGVLLTFAMSLYETMHHGHYAYFDAAVSLLFFLLIGRTLDHVMRERARQAVGGLARLSPRGALVLRQDGSRTYLSLDEIEAGMTILLAAGERVPVDASVIRGNSEIDLSLVSGESAPQTVGEGTRLQAGVLNLTGPLTIVATTTAKNSFLAELVRMMEAAEAGRSSYRRIADRAAQLYAPVIHSLALLTFTGWMIAGGDAHFAITAAVAVLIVTCPCALGLAVPMVHVVAARRLFEKGIMIKDGGALERLAGIDTVIFDKTGTLTSAQPRPTVQDSAGANALALAAATAAHSRHPYSQALATLGQDRAVVFDSVSELPGTGIEARHGNDVYRLGRPDWALAEHALSPAQRDATVALAINGEAHASFGLDDRLRLGAAEAVAELKGLGASVEILSGDKNVRVQKIARQLEVTCVAEARPADKIGHIEAFKQDGKKVLMVGDGLNDAPALRAADVSMAPASASDIGRNAADLIFLRESLTAVPQAITIAKAAGRLVRQNFALSIAYNIVAVPLAVLGGLTPLLAAIAMSLSSITVVLNALRLGIPLPGRSPRPAAVERKTPVLLEALK
jgi:P-type Cu2+ transporter